MLIIGYRIASENFFGKTIIFIVITNLFMETQNALNLQNNSVHNL